MPTSTRMPIRTEILKWAFALYATLSLGSMATMSIGAAFLIAILIFTSQSWESLKIEFRTLWRNSAFQVYFILSLILSIACLTSLLGAKFFPLSYLGHSTQIHFFKDMAKAWYLFWPCLLVLGLKRLSHSNLRFVFISWIFTFAALSAFGILQYFIGWPKYQQIPGENSHYHATLFLGHHLSVASIFIFPFFAALDLSQSKKERKPWFFLIAAILGGLTLFLSYSRALWIALPLGVGIWIFWVLPKRTRLALLCSVVIGIAGLSQYPPIQNRMKADIGIGTRESLWEANWQFFKHRPLSGVGWHQNQELSGYYLMEKYKTDHVFSGHAHNNWIDMLGGLGLFGLLSWSAWCFWIFWILFQKKPTPLYPEFSRGLVCAWFVFHINGLTQLNFWEAKVQHQMAWAIAWSLLWICHR